MTCKLCNTKTNYLENHHIVPRSRGGADDENNLIKICIDCHGKAHNVNFKRKKGLVSVAVKKTILELSMSREWCSNNEERIAEKMKQIADDDIDKLQFINYLMHNCDTFTARNIKELVLYNTTKINLTI